MRKALKWWWGWAGPESPIGTASAALIFIPSIVVAGAIILPPIIWLITQTVGPWWRYWLG